MIYCDFVSWGFYQPSLTSLQQFLLEPTWLMVTLWGHYLTERTKEINLNSVATAKMALLLEMGLSSFGGGANKVVQDIKRFLPFSIYGETSIDQETIDIFWQVNDANILPNYFQSALIKDTDLLETLKNGK